MSKRSTTEEFIEKAKFIHGDTYDYCLVDYKTAIIKVKILCKKHGVFEQVPNAHLSRQGCPKCRGTIKSTTKEFICKAIKRHGNKYDYSLVEYKNNSTNVTISCPIHGNWWQTPNNHLRGKGCPRCAGLNKTTDIVIEEFKKVHGHKYDYSLVDYKHAHTKVIVICKDHGEFKQTPDKHLSGQGCRLCGRIETQKSIENSPMGWSIVAWEKAALKSKTFDNFKVYIIRCYNNNEQFYKIGRTFNSVKKRFKSGLPYRYEIIKEFIFDNAKDAFDKENELKRLNKANKYVPLITFGGRYECFSKLHDYKY